MALGYIMSMDVSGRPHKSADIKRFIDEPQGLFGEISMISGDKKNITLLRFPKWFELYGSIHSTNFSECVYLKVQVQVYLPYSMYSTCNEPTNW